jgi:hypothetical protein
MRMKMKIVMILKKKMLAVLIQRGHHST